jgi:hypothetical protein
MKWNVVLDFANISFTMETKAGTLKIAQNFVPADDVDKDEFNLIDTKELESYLKNGAEIMLFFAKEGHEIDLPFLDWNIATAFAKILE